MKRSFSTRGLIFVIILMCLNFFSLIGGYYIGINRFAIGHSILPFVMAIKPATQKNPTKDVLEPLDPSFAAAFEINV